MLLSVHFDTSSLNGAYYPGPPAPKTSESQNLIQNLNSGHDSKLNNLNLFSLSTIHRFAYPVNPTH